MNMSTIVTALQYLGYILIFPGFLFCFLAGLLLCGIDRKVVAKMQKRVGPPLLQPFYDFFKLLGKETIDTYNTGESRGRETSHSLNYQKLGKELMSQDELAVMDGGKCILQLRGVRPFLSDKYDITKHPNYHLTADADPRNAFDIEQFLSTRLKPKPNEVYEVFEVDTTDGAPD